MTTPTTNDTGCRMFALEKALMVHAGAPTTPDAIVETAEKFAEFLTPPRAPVSNILKVRQ